MKCVVCGWPGLGHPAVIIRTRIGESAMSYSLLRYLETERSRSDAVPDGLLQLGQDARRRLAGIDIHGACGGGILWVRQRRPRAARRPELHDQVERAQVRRRQA